MLNVEILKQLIDFAETDEKMHPNTVNMCEIIKKIFFKGLSHTCRGLRSSFSKTFDIEKQFSYIMMRLFTSDLLGK